MRLPPLLIRGLHAVFAYLGGLKEYCKCPPVLKRAEGKAEEKRERKRHKCKKVRKDLLVQSKQTVISQAARARVDKERRMMMKEGTQRDEEEGAGDLYKPSEEGRLD